MPTHVLLSTLTTEGRQTMHAHPERLDAVNHEIEKLGCRVLSQYAVLGGYDFVTVVHAPDIETAAHLSVDLDSRGTVQITTLPAIEIADLTRKLQGSDQIGRTQDQPQLRVRRPNHWHTRGR